MTSQTRQQMIKIRILSNTSRNKDNQSTKFGQLIKYKVENVFFHAENDGARPLFVF